MTVPIDDFVASDKRIPMRELIAGLQATLHSNHLKILEAARSEWERKHAGDDPTDACATIRIEAKTSAKKRPKKRAAPPHWQSLN